MAETITETTAPFRRLRPLRTGEVHWTRGFWANRFKQTHTVTLPEMRAAMDDLNNGAVFANFYVAAGLQPGSHRGTNWSDGDCYKWMEAATYVYGVTQDPALDGALDDLIAVIAQAQEADGYLCTQIQLDPGKARWEKRHYHELYNMGHLMTAASAHHRITGKDNFLAIARKLADYLYGVFAPRPKELAHFGWNPSNIMGLIDLHRETSEPRHLELAQLFVEMRGSEPWPHNPWDEAATRDPHPGDQTQDRVPLREESDAVGHAVTATYLYAGAADVYAETGDDALLQALERIWVSSAQRKLYITGAVGALHHGVSKRGDRVHEAYGLDYELPNASAYNETCANIGNAMWAWRMLQLTGAAHYAEVLERVIYNAGLSPVSLDGMHFCYTNPLRWYGADHDALSHDTAERWVTHDCYCCPPQVARTLARMHEWAYSLGRDRDLWVHLYSGSRLDTDLEGDRINMTQTSGYPWTGQIAFEILQTPRESWTLRLRIPEWAEGARIEINHQPLEIPVEPCTYAALTRIWAPGDIVELMLPMAARLIQAHPRVEAARNQVAVMRGPIVYCLESLDLPEGVALSEVSLPHELVFTPWQNAHELGGAVTLAGTALRSPGPGDPAALYYPLPATEPEPINVRLIPYYAWNNRGTAEMAVWLPLA